MGAPRHSSSYAYSLRAPLDCGDQRGCLQTVPFRECDCRRNDILRARERAARGGVGALAGAAGDGALRALAHVAGAGASAAAGLSGVRIAEAIGAGLDLDMDDVEAGAAALKAKAAKAKQKVIEKVVLKEGAPPDRALEGAAGAAVAGAAGRRGSVALEGAAGAAVAGAGRRGSAAQPPPSDGDAPLPSRGAARRRSHIEVDRSRRRSSIVADDADALPTHTDCRRPAFVVVKVLSTHDEVVRRVRVASRLHSVGVCACVRACVRVCMFAATVHHHTRKHAHTLTGGGGCGSCTTLGDARCHRPGLADRDPGGGRQARAGGQATHGAAARPSQHCRKTGTLGRAQRIATFALLLTH
jgi:hypothetical protein